MEKDFSRKDMIGLIYRAQEDKIDEIIKKVNKEIKNDIKSINIEDIINSSNEPNKMNEIFNKIEDNYNIRICRYNEEMYKKGFIDGVNFMLNCLKENRK